MTFSIKIPTLPSSFTHCSCTTSYNFDKPPPKSNNFRLKPVKFRSLTLKITNCVKNPTFSQLISSPDDEIYHISSYDLLSMRLRRLVSEFRAVSEPIDRVKRLLGYATVLPQLGELTRSPENRVKGCAAQVWLEVVKGEMGRMRFGADSDSEITKGFCSCLIFLLDGAYPEDILKVKAEDLTDMNMGIPVRSRVNSWHNVLVNMQERTKAFLSNKIKKYAIQMIPWKLLLLWLFLLILTTHPAEMTESCSLISFSLMTWDVWFCTLLSFVIFQ